MGFGEGREKLFFRKVFPPFPNLPLLLPHQPRDLLPQDAGGGLGGDAVKLVLNAAHDVGGDGFGVGEIRQDKLRKRAVLQLLHAPLQLLQSAGRSVLLLGGCLLYTSPSPRD